MRVNDGLDVYNKLGFLHCLFSHYWWPLRRQGFLVDACVADDVKYFATISVVNISLCDNSKDSVYTKFIVKPDRPAILKKHMAQLLYNAAVGPSLVQTVLVLPPCGRLHVERKNRFHYIREPEIFLSHRELSTRNSNIHWKFKYKTITFTYVGFYLKYDEYKCQKQKKKKLLSTGK